MTRHRQQPVLRTARAFWPILIGLIAVVVIMAVSTYRGGLDRAAWDPADRWKGDANSALARAQEADLPVLMVFSQPGCPPCIRLKKDVLGSEQFLAKVDGRAVLADVDVTADREGHALFRRFGFNSTPSIALTDARGGLIAIYPWGRDAPGLDKWLGSQLESAENPPTTQPVGLQ